MLTSLSAVLSSTCSAIDSEEIQLAGVVIARGPPLQEQMHSLET